MGLMLVGAAFLAVLFAFFTSWVMTRRQEVLKGLVQVRWKDHVVIAGGGHMGDRRRDLVAAAGRRIVVIERDEDRPHIEMLRAAGHRVVIARRDQGRGPGAGRGQAGGGAGRADRRGSDQPAHRAARAGRSAPTWRS